MLIHPDWALLVPYSARAEQDTAFAVELSRTEDHGNKLPLDQRRDASSLQSPTSKLVADAILFNSPIISSVRLVDEMVEIPSPCDLRRKKMPTYYFAPAHTETGSTFANEYLIRLENELLRCGVSVDRLYDLRDAAEEHVELQMEGEGY